MKKLLRFITAGSVDDGKSTLIGRLLYDSKAIFDDQLEAIKLFSDKRGFDFIDLSLLTDGLKSEREQGITIDVAYRYFASPNRKFIIADTPGHIQYTRNMITGASTANLAIILIDARKGLVEQTYRHSLIASLVGVSHILVCVNKMDLVNFDEHTYASIVSRYKEFSSRLDVCEILFVPISALVGDNIVYRSENMPWYTGPPLLDILETVEVEKDESLKESRFPVQYVVRPQSILHHDFRGYAGRVVGGVFRVGDEITTLPASLKSKVKEIWLGREKINEAFSSMSVLITLEHDIDVSRGDIIVKLELPKITHEFELMICWMAHRPLLLNNRFSVQHTTREVKGVLQDIKYKLDINTGRQITGVDHLMMNDIACVKLITSQPLFVDSYRRNRTTGSLIFVDDSSNETLAAGMII